MAQGDLRSQRFEVIALLSPGCRLAQITIEDLDALGMPAQALGALDEGTLGELTVEMLTHLLRARLANVNNRFACKMLRGELHLAQGEIGGHGLSPYIVRDLARAPLTVERRGGAPAGRAVAAGWRGVATVDRGLSGRRSGTAAPLGRAGLASLLTP